MRPRTLIFPAAVAGALALAGGVVTGIAEAAETDGLTATYHAASAWDGGQLGGYTVANTGEETVRGWTLAFRLPAGAAVDALGGGELTTRGQDHFVTSDASTGVLEPGERVVVTFTVLGVSGIVPADCFINDHECAAEDPGPAGRVFYGGGYVKGPDVP